MNIETGCVIGDGGVALHWHLPPGRSAAFLPDDRDLWRVFWDRRGALTGFAHSHPGSGRPSPSHEDVTTFAAVETGLGRRLNWWITSRDELALVTWDSGGYVSYDVARSYETPWLARLRELSYGP